MALPNVAHSEYDLAEYDLQKHKHKGTLTYYLPMILAKFWTSPCA